MGLFDSESMTKSLINVTLILLISAGSMWYTHEWAHSYYGTGADAIGDVGSVVFIVAGLGTLVALLATEKGMNWIGSFY